MRLDPEEEHLRHRLSTDGAGYLQYTDQARTRRLHTEIMPTAPKGYVVDHINGDKTDCRRSNLRYVPHWVNMHNTDKVWGEIPHRGVARRRNKYRAYISRLGRQSNLGTYGTVEEAVAARLKAEEELVGIQPQRKELYGIS